MISLFLIFENNYELKHVKSKQIIHVMFISVENILEQWFKIVKTKEENNDIVDNNVVNNLTLCAHTLPSQKSCIWN